MKKTVIWIPFLLLAACISSGRPGEPKYLIKEEFEKENISAWQDRGGCQVALSGEVAFKGEASLKITGRDNEEDGCVYDITPFLKKGEQYRISAWVRLTDGSPVSEVRMSIQRHLDGDSRLDMIAGPLRIPGGHWFNLEADYIFVSPVDKIELSFESLDKETGFYLDNVTLYKLGEVDVSGMEQMMERDVPSLAQSWEGVFPVGAAVAPYQLFGEEKKLIDYHFNSITPENAMKPDAIQPEEGLFTFAKADKLVEFAQATGKLVRGHTLVWHQAVPDWFFIGEQGERVSRDVLLKRLETHIKTLVGHYKGKVYAWDVVNEPVEKYSEDDYRHSEWFEIIGEEYIELAFRWAHEADPGAKLFLNDYNVFDLQKGRKIYNLVERLLAKGVPVHGLGIQLHISITRPDISAIEKTLEMFRNLGLEIHVTELDMTIYEGDEQADFGVVPAQVLVRQGHRYKEIFSVLAANSDIVRNVTFWGYQDGDSFMTREAGARANAPLLFTSTLKAKLALWGLIEPSRLPPDVVLDKNLKEAAVVEAIRGTPVIDGREDEIWKQANTIYTEIFIIRNQGATAEVRTMWDEDYLYILAHVKDSNVRVASRNAWEQDSFEIFIDENNAKTSDYEQDDAQYRINCNNEQTFGGFPAELISETTRVNDGYIVEAAVAFKTISPASGRVIGFDIQVNDDQGSGTRDSASKWNDPTNEGYRNTSQFGNLVMIE